MAWPVTASKLKKARNTSGTYETMAQLSVYYLQACRYDSLSCRTPNKTYQTYSAGILLLQVGCSRQNSDRYVVESVEPSIHLQVSIALFPS